MKLLKSGIYADYLLVDSWYAKPNFIYEIKKKVNLIADYQNQINLAIYRKI